MENLKIDELKELLKFYIKKASDLELSLLESQLKINSSTVESMSLKSQLDSLKKEIQSLKETNEKLDSETKVKKTKKSTVKK